ncbi:hypothetical protein IAR55_001677 [Kwoniella newhampshirensis]|uniref:Uncharacterized protein n=1 Tax=Kwoniella newhampshirensis TaxID=1651941 RepID=A0AAW0Z2P1_9TREE
MSTMTSPRPSTPFPYTHTLTHGHHGSYFHLSPQPHAYTSQPIHFHMPALPSPTPPSLLKRQSSSGSNTGRHGSVSSTASSSSSTGSTASAVTPSSPRLMAPAPRRISSTRSSISSSSASISSPPMPTTPTLSSPSAPPPTPLSLPPPAHSHKSMQVISELDHPDLDLGFSYDPFSTTLLSGEEIATLPYLSPLDEKEEKMERPIRPKLKRRDTPRPKTTTLGSLRMSGMVASHDHVNDQEYRDAEERKVLRSVIDGGSWVILV